MFELPIQLRLIISFIALAGSSYAGYYFRGLQDNKQIAAIKLAEQEQYSKQLKANNDYLNQYYTKQLVAINTANSQLVDERNKVYAQYKKYVASDAITGGLRINSSICSTVSTTNKASTGTNETTSSPILLPTEITANLRQLEREADEAVAQCRALQTYIGEQTK